MNRKVALISALVLSVFVFGCGEDGSDGPAGPAGNANVVMLDFPAQTSVGALMSFDYEIDRATMDRSMVQIYYNPSTEAETAWYHAPGLGSGGAYMTRTWWYQTSTTPSTYTFYIRFLTPDGAGNYGSAITADQTHIYLVPASTVVTMSPTAAPLDYSDYDAFKAYYGIENQ